MPEATAVTLPAPRVLYIPVGWVCVVGSPPRARRARRRGRGGGGPPERPCWPRAEVRWRRRPAFHPPAEGGRASSHTALWRTRQGGERQRASPRAGRARGGKCLRGRRRRQAGSTATAAPRRRDRPRRAPSANWVAPPCAGGQSGGAAARRPFPTNVSTPAAARRAPAPRTRWKKERGAAAVRAGRAGGSAAAARAWSCERGSPQRPRRAAAVGGRASPPRPPTRRAAGCGGALGHVSLLFRPLGGGPRPRPRRSRISAASRPPPALPAALPARRRPPHQCGMPHGGGGGGGGCDCPASSPPCPHTARPPRAPYGKTACTPAQGRRTPAGLPLCAIRGLLHQGVPSLRGGCEAHSSVFPHPRSGAPSQRRLCVLPCPSSGGLTGWHLAVRPIKRRPGSCPRPPVHPPPPPFPNNTLFPAPPTAPPVRLTVWQHRLSAPCFLSSRGRRSPSAVVRRPVGAGLGSSKQAPAAPPHGRPAGDSRPGARRVDHQTGTASPPSWRSPPQGVPARGPNGCCACCRCWSWLWRYAGRSAPSASSVASPLGRTLG